MGYRYVWECGKMLYGSIKKGNIFEIGILDMTLKLYIMEPKKRITNILDYCKSVTSLKIARSTWSFYYRVFF